jgi:hypothetical protein
VHNQEQNDKGDESKSPKEGYAWCLPWSRERGKLTSVKLGVLSNPTGLEPMRYNARALTKEA